MKIVKMNNIGRKFFNKVNKLNCSLSASKTSIVKNSGHSTMKSYIPIASYSYSIFTVSVRHYVSSVSNFHRMSFFCQHIREVSSYSSRTFYAADRVNHKDFHCYLLSMPSGISYLK